MNPKPTRYDRKFARITRRLRHFPRGRSSQKERWDIFEDLSSGSSSELFLGVYGDLAIMDLLGEYGLLDALAKQDINQPVLEMELSDPYRHILRLYNDQASSQRLVAELVFRRTVLVQSNRPVNQDHQHDCLHLEWILLQNPYRQFDDKHPALPQQEYPGLAMGDMVLTLISQMARVLHLSGVVTVPANLHSALYFLRSYLAVSPIVQSELLSLERTVKKFGRAEVAWAEQWGDLLDSSTARPYRWLPSEMVQPLSDELQAWFEDHEDYTRELENSQPHYNIREGVKIRSLRNGRIVREYKAQESKRDQN